MKRYYYKELNGEKALDALADLMDPIAVLAEDKELVGLLRAKKYMKAIQIALRTYKPEILTILAILNGENPKTYAPNLMEIPAMLLDILNDPAVTSLFLSQVQDLEETSSGPAPGNTEGQ